MNTEKFCSTQQAADLIGLTRHTIARYCGSGRIEVVGIRLETLDVKQPVPWIPSRSKGRAVRS